MKRLLPFMVIYVLVHSAQGDGVRSYEGQDQPTITSNLSIEGKTGDFITKEDYDAFIVAHTPAPLTPAQILSALRSGALDQLNVDPSSNAKVIRAVFLVELDEINTIRGLLVPTQSPRTITQFKTAVQNKITSGAAD